MKAFIVIFLFVFSGNNLFAQLQTIFLRGQAAYCIPDTNRFVLKRIKEPTNPKDLNTFKRLKALNQKEVDAWFSPMFEYRKEASNLIKLASYQGKTLNYSVIIIWEVEEFYEKKAYGTQYLATISPNGQLISYMRVFDDIKNNDTDPANRENNFRHEVNAYLAYELQNTKFIGNKIFLYEDAEYWPKSSENSEGAFIKKYVSEYEIQEDGMIKMLKGRSEVEN